MHTRCPSCRARLEIADVPTDVLNSISSVECPNCGLIPVNLDQSTISFKEAPQEDDPETLAHFQLIRLLGRGSFGSVWLAYDTALERQVALKTVAANLEDTDILLHEAHAVAKLNHPNIVSVYEVGSENGRFYLASEFIDGLNLRDALSAGKPTQERAVDLALAIAKALGHAHEQGIIHRDIKPANIMLDTKGQPFVADFGLAKRMASDVSISSEGQILGTALYMSPEQAGGNTLETDGRSDLYALGVILFEMLTGHVPFRGNAQAVLHQKTHEDAPSARTLNPNIPKDLETICLKCLERDPDKRYQSAAEVAAELERFKSGLPIHARPVSSFEKAWRWCLRHRAVAGLVMGLILTLTLGLAGVTYFGLRAAANARLANERLHRAEMKVVAQYLANGDINGVRRTLERFETDAHLRKLRGFAWHYHKTAITPFLQVSNQGDPVVDVAVFPGGKFYAACGRNREIRVWDAKSGELLRTLSLEVGQIQAIAVSPADSRLASGSTDGFLRIWDPLEHGRPIRQIKHGPAVAFVGFSRTGKFLLSAGLRGAVRIWNAGTGDLQTQIPTGMSGTKAVRFSPDGKSIAVATGDGRIRLTEIESGTILKILETDSSIESLAYSDDGKTLAVGGFTGTIEIWSVEDGVRIFEYPMGLGIVGDMEFLKQTPLLALPAITGHLVIFDTEKGEEIRSLITHNLTTGIVDRSADGRVLAVGSGGGSVKLLDVAMLSDPNIYWHNKTGAEVGKPGKGNENPLRSIAFLPNCKHLLAGSADGAVTLWNTSDGKSQNLLPAGEDDRMLEMAASASGRFIAVALWNSGVTLWALEDGKLSGQTELSGSHVSALAFASAKDALAFAGGEGRIALYTAPDWKTPVFEETPHEGKVHALTFSPDDRTLAVAYQDGTVSFLDAASGQTKGENMQLPVMPVSLEFCRDGKLLAVGTEAGELQLFETAGRSLVRTIQAHASRVNVVTAFPDGLTILSGGRDKELKLWDVESGELITTLYGHNRQILSIAVSPDGKTVASGGLMGDIRLWRSEAP